VKKAIERGKIQSDYITEKGEITHQTSGVGYMEKN
jgi:hypothetical protein